MFCVDSVLIDMLLTRSGSTAIATLHLGNTAERPNNNVRARSRFQGMSPGTKLFDVCDLLWIGRLV